MSAFIVDHGTIDVVVEAMSPQEYSYSAKEHLGAQLVQMNCDAFNERYQASEYIASEVPEPYNYVPVMYLSKPARLKAIQCYCYQCLEGDVPERALFKRVEETLNFLAREIVEAMPEYEAAEWGATRTRGELVE